MKKLIKPPSPAMIVALVALFVAMGGSAYAIKKNSVGTKQLKNNAVTTKKIKAGAVSPSKLSAGTLLGEVAAYASIDGFGPTIQGNYKKNVTAVRKLSTGLYCLTIDWAAAGRTPVSQATPVVVSPRSPSQTGGGDYYPPGACSGANEVAISLENSAGNPADGWVTVLIP